MCSPTLGTKTKTRQGWGTEICGTRGIKRPDHSENASGITLSQRVGGRQARGRAQAVWSGRGDMGPAAVLVESMLGAATE